MDFIEGLLRLMGCNAIFVVVDRLCKAAYFLAVKHPFTTKIVANPFIKEAVCLLGSFYRSFRIETRFL